MTHLNNIVKIINGIASTGMEHQRCYIYQPPEIEERTSKRQRTGKSHFQPKLQERLQTYRELWAQQEQRIQVLTTSIYHLV